MSEKRFIISKNTGERFPTGIIDVERQTHLWVVEVVDLLNELVKDNEELGISIKLFEDDIATKDKKIEEQQATIKKLQDLCGESDSENAKLRIENKELQEEIKLLKPVNIEQYEQIVQLQEENEQLRENLHNCRLNKTIVREKLKQWQEVHKEYDIYNIKDFEELMKSIK